ncbi:MAG: IS1182 family transposase [Saprospiraceae bacterium]
MKFIKGKDRNQIEFFCLDQVISDDNEVRFIDLFLQAVNLEDFGFKMDFIENGRPAYHPADLLRLFIYGYLNRIRHSRQLEKECHRNLEVMWLMKGLAPDHNTISNFRRDNPKSIRKVFHAAVKLAKNFDLIGGKLIAGDGTKLRAQNSKKNNFNAKKIDRHIAYIDNKLEEYMAILAEEDNDLTEADKSEIQAKIEKHEKNKATYQDYQKQLETSGETQISTSDPESRHLLIRGNHSEVAYNIQSTVDAKNNIPIDFKVTNQTDSHAMGSITRRANKILGTNEYTGLFDKGYFAGSEFDYAHKLGVNVLVGIPKVKSHAPDYGFDVTHFEYIKKEDVHICPAGKRLTTNGKWYTKDYGKTTIRAKRYKTNACKTCPLIEKCTKNQKGRTIDRNEYADLIEANQERMKKNKELYSRRQAIVEHPFGTIKRQWGFDYIITKKTMNRATADVGLIFTCYVLRRILNLVDKNKLKKFLIELCLIFSAYISHFKAISRYFFFKPEHPKFEISFPRYL